MAPPQPPAPALVKEAPPRLPSCDFQSNIPPSTVPATPDTAERRNAPGSSRAASRTGRRPFSPMTPLLDHAFMPTIGGGGGLDGGGRVVTTAPDSIWSSSDQSTPGTGTGGRGGRGGRGERGGGLGADSMHAMDSMTQSIGTFGRGMPGASPMAPVSAGSHRQRGQHGAGSQRKLATAPVSGRPLGGLGATSDGGYRASSSSSSSSLSGNDTNPSFGVARTPVHSEGGRSIENASRGDGRDEGRSAAGRIKRAARAARDARVARLAQTPAPAFDASGNVVGVGRPRAAPGEGEDVKAVMGRAKMVLTKMAISASPLPTAFAARAAAAMDVVATPAASSLQGGAGTPGPRGLSRGWGDMFGGAPLEVANQPMNLPPSFPGMAGGMAPSELYASTMASMAAMASNVASGAAPPTWVDKHARLRGKLASRDHQRVETLIGGGHCTWARLKLAPPLQRLGQVPLTRLQIQMAKEPKEVEDRAFGLCWAVCATLNTANDAVQSIAEVEAEQRSKMRSMLGKDFNTMVQEYGARLGQVATAKSSSSSSSSNRSRSSKSGKSGNSSASGTSGASRTRRRNGLRRRGHDFLAGLPREHTVEKLLPSTVYWFRVRFGNYKQWSSPSLPLRVETAPLIWPEAPPRPKLLDVARTSLRVSWGGGIDYRYRVDGYEVQVSADNVRWSRRILVGPLGTLTTALARRKAKYVNKVQAANGGGDGEGGSGEGGVGGSGGGGKGVGGGNDGAGSTPSQSQKQSRSKSRSRYGGSAAKGSKGYSKEVIATETAAAAAAAMEVAPLDEEGRGLMDGVACEGAAGDLLGGRHYFVRVKAHNAVGWSAPGPTLQIRTEPPGTPLRPDPPVLVQRSATTLLIQWAPPAHDGALVTDVDIEISVDQHVAQERLREWVFSGKVAVPPLPDGVDPALPPSMEALRGHSLYRVTGLTPGTAYFVRVRGNSLSGPGRWCGPAMHATTRQFRVNQDVVRAKLREGVWTSGEGWFKVVITGVDSKGTAGFHATHHYDVQSVEFPACRATVASSDIGEIIEDLDVMAGDRRRSVLLGTSAAGGRQVEGTSMSTPPMSVPSPSRRAGAGTGRGVGMTGSGTNGNGGGGGELQASKTTSQVRELVSTLRLEDEARRPNPLHATPDAVIDRDSFQSGSLQHTIVHMNQDTVMLSGKLAVGGGTFDTVGEFVKGDRQAFHS